MTLARAFMSTIQKLARILLLDDDSFVLGLQKHMVSSLGYKIKTESNPMAALETLTSQTFDLIISDFDMPQMNGVEFTQLFREWEEKNSSKWTPIIICSGNSGEEFELICHTYGIIEVLLKPVNI